MEEQNDDRRDASQRIELCYTSAHLRFSPNAPPDGRSRPFLNPTEETGDPTQSYEEGELMQT